MKSIFDILKKYKTIDLINKKEYKFFKENEELFSKINLIYKLPPFEDDLFSLIKANILIRSFKNELLFRNCIVEQASLLSDVQDDKYKIIRDKLWNELEEKNAPYFTLNEARIYIPHFSRGLNIIYNDDSEKILEYPYSNLSEKPSSACIDPFDVYNFSLFESKFSNLIKLKKVGHTVAYYHEEFETIFIVTEQGRVEHEIRLFDDYMHSFNKEDLISRINNVLDSYFSNNRDEFIIKLSENKLISSRCYHRLARQAYFLDLRRMKFLIVSGVKKR